ncbi:endonuclease/exonuclease/phosphatase family protein [Thalassotalea hakodatensis]|uniref:endonuclease/exonuclease/phosphatase family protein n=1 Tax=Thalassotalea hakodatensis TaxID=3030492 RepID=UPI00257487E1|nr:endonuclease/exonuclease/phosphatase family protein [Thalassotalea hakodatensis]
MSLLLAICTVLVVLLTLLPLSRHPHWIIRGLDFPRLQLGILIAVLLIADYLFLDKQSLQTWLLLSISTFCLIWQLWWIIPYTSLWSKEVKQAKKGNADNQIIIMTANVLTSNRNADSLIQMVEKHCPDVLVTLESDQWWEDKLNAVEGDMSYAVKCPLDNLYGMHVYSRLPILEHEIAYLVEDDVPSIYAKIKLRSGELVRMHFIHPAPPSPTENPESAERDAELVVVARSVIERDLPVIVTGDLNDVAWSSTTRLFRKISGLLDPRIGRGMFNTFHANYFFMRWPLDHLFHSEHFTLNFIKRLPAFGSDHFPLLTKLTYMPKRAVEQSGIDPDVDDLNRSKEIVNEESVSKENVPKPS